MKCYIMKMNELQLFTLEQTNLYHSMRCKYIIKIGEHTTISFIFTSINRQN